MAFKCHSFYCIMYVLFAMAHCQSICHKLVFSQKGWLDQAGSWHRRYSWLILHCVMCIMRIWVFSKIRVLLSGTISHTLNWASFAILLWCLYWCPALMAFKCHSFYCIMHVLFAMAHCQSICHKLVFSQKGWLDQAGFWHRHYSWLILHCVMCIMRIWVFSKIRVLLSGTLSHTLNWASFAILLWCLSTIESVVSICDGQLSCHLCLTITSLSCWVPTFVYNIMTVMQSILWFFYELKVVKC